MEGESGSLVNTLMSLPIFQAEWVLYLLIILSLASMAVMIERVVFYRRHRVRIDEIREKLNGFLAEGDYDAAAEYLSQYDSLATNVVLFGLRDHNQGPESVEDLIRGALRREQERYDRRLGFLATVASNAPFIGLFGTVLGIIRAFKDLSANLGEASNSVMYGIAEALIATAVGLMVAIPAVVAFNFFKARVKLVVDDAQLLIATLLARLKSEEPVSAEG